MLLMPACLDTRNAPWVTVSTMNAMKRQIPVGLMVFKKSRRATVLYITDRCKSASPKIPKHLG